MIYLYWLDGFLAGAIVLTVLSPTMIRLFLGVKSEAIKRYGFGSIALLLLFAFLNAHSNETDSPALIVFAPVSVFLPYTLWALVESIHQPMEQFATKRTVYFWLNAVVGTLGFMMWMHRPETSYFNVNMFATARSVMAVFFGFEIIRGVGLSETHSHLPQHNRKRRRVMGILSGFILICFTGVSYVGTSLLYPMPEIDLLTTKVIQNAVILSVLATHLFLIHPSSLKSFFLPKKALGEDSTEVLNHPLHLKSQTLLLEEQVYKDSNITISQFSQKLGVSEASTREYIQNELGFRNFNDFMNDYRVRYAASMLESAEFGHLKISAIAFQCGFNSLSPFNRSFLRVFKMPPSEYRTRQSSAA